MTPQDFINEITAQAKAKGINPDLVFQHEIVNNSSSTQTLNIEVKPDTQTINVTWKDTF